MLPPADLSLIDQLCLCDAIVLVGGDDPRTEAFGEPTHPAATPVAPLRQRIETQLLEHLQQNAPDIPVLGVCLGMQMMALVAGAHLNQHLPDTHDTAGMHWANTHDIIPSQGSFLKAGSVHSMHRQAIDDPGRLVVLAHAPDGIIEAVGDPIRRCYLGVQWHPERTQDQALGQDLFDHLVQHAV